MAESQLTIRCQRCGEQMEMKEPAADQPWRPDQFWVCPRCSRHFWTTYPNRPAAAAGPAAVPSAAPAAPPAGSSPPGSPDTQKP